MICRFRVPVACVGGVSLQREAIHVPALVTEVVGGFQSGAMAKGVTLQSFSGPEVGPFPPDVTRSAGS